MATDDDRTNAPHPGPSSSAGGGGDAGSASAAAGRGGSAQQDRAAGAGRTPSAAPERTQQPRKVDLATDSRTARAWTAWIVGAVILIFLLVFIIQNAASADFQFFAWHFQLPLGVAILLAGIAGALITALLGAARMLQMRRAARKRR